MVQKDNMKGSTNKNFVFHKAKLRVQQTETKGPTKQNYRLDKTNYGSNKAKLQNGFSKEKLRVKQSKTKGSPKQKLRVRQSKI